MGDLAHFSFSINHNVGSYVPFQATILKRRPHDWFHRQEVLSQRRLVEQHGLQWLGISTLGLGIEEARRHFSQIFQGHNLRGHFGRSPAHSTGNQSAVKILAILEVSTPAEAVGVQQTSSSGLQRNTGAQNVMDFRGSRVRRPIDIDLLHYSANFGGLRVLQNLIERRHRADQFQSEFAQPFRQKVAIIFLPVAATIYDLDLMKLWRLQLALPSLGRRPPYLHLAVSAGIFVPLEARRQYGL